MSLLSKSAVISTAGGFDLAAALLGPGPGSLLEAPVAGVGGSLLFAEKVALVVEGVSSILFKRGLYRREEIVSVSRVGLGDGLFLESVRRDGLILASIFSMEAKCLLGVPFIVFPGLTAREPIRLEFLEKPIIAESLPSPKGGVPRLNMTSSNFTTSAVRRDRAIVCFGCYCCDFSVVVAVDVFVVVVVVFVAVIGISDFPLLL